MAIRLHEVEPAAVPCRVAPLASLVDVLRTAIGPVPGRPAVVAVDGRGGSGKTTLTDRLRREIPGSQVVHTDDVAWMHSRFGWADLMISGVLEPLHRGESVSYRPPAWDVHDRHGRIDVDAAATLVIIEGVGASRRECADLLDASVWVQADWVDAEQRGRARDGDHPDAVAQWHAWQVEELPFLATDRPWERADAVVVVTPEITCVGDDEVVLADAPKRSPDGRPLPFGS